MYQARDENKYTDPSLICGKAMDILSTWVYTKQHPLDWSQVDKKIIVAGGGIW